MKSWQKVYQHGNAIRAEIVKDQLINHQIPAVVVPKKDSNYVHLGHYEVHVNQEDVLKAIKLIENDIRFDEI